jgi:5-methylcytosine-specific restriction endonuclease McrA
MSKKTKNTQPYLLSNLEYLYNQKKLWLNPEYQRESVWTISQKQLFMDSLLIGIDIPKLYFRNIDKAGYEYEVVDGQQRLRTVFEFFEDGFEMPEESDDVEGHEVKNRVFNELHTDLQMKLRNTPLDVVVLSSAYTDDDIEETFLRLQNGTPLNAAEKRRAVTGSMKSVVQDLAGHQVFSLCSFKNKRFAYEDAAAKILHLLLAGTITDIKPISIKKTYEENKTITLTHNTVAKAEKAFRFILKAFKGGPSPKLKKFSIITLTYLTVELLEKYNLTSFPKDFAESYIQFELARRQNEELPEDEQNPKLAAYTDAARSDSIQDMRYRHEMLREVIVREIPDLILKDPARGFSDEQRAAIYWRDGGRCKSCGKECEENEFHADHIKPHNKGGQTKIANGQVLCPGCNLKKGGRVPKTARKSTTRTLGQHSE